MLFDEDPAMVGALCSGLSREFAILICLKLVQSTMANFHIETDKIAIGRINDSLSTLQQARDLRIREAENALKSEPAFLELHRSSKADRTPRNVTQFCDHVTAA